MNHGPRWMLSFPAFPAPNPVPVRREMQRNIDADFIDRHPERTDAHSDRGGNTNGDRWVGGKLKQEVKSLYLNRPEIEMQGNDELDSRATLKRNSTLRTPSRRKLERRLHLDSAENRLDEAVTIRHVDDELPSAQFGPDDRFAF